MTLILLLIGVVSLFLCIRLTRKWHIIRAYKILTGKSQQEDLMAIRESEINLQNKSKNKSKTSGTTSITLNERTESIDSHTEDSVVMEDVFDEARRRHIEDVNAKLSQTGSTKMRSDTDNTPSPTSVLIEESSEIDEEDFLSPEATSIMEDPGDIDNIDDTLNNAEPVNQVEDTQKQEEDFSIPVSATSIMDEESEQTPQKPDTQNVSDTTGSEQAEDATFYQSDGQQTGVLLDEEELNIVTNSEVKSTGENDNSDTILETKILSLDHFGAVKRLKETLNEQEEKQKQQEKK